MCAGVSQSRAPVSDPDVRAAIDPVMCQGPTHHLPDVLESVCAVVGQEVVDDVASCRAGAVLHASGAETGYRSRSSAARPSCTSATAAPSRRATDARS
ncbi:hypothetical protein [Streptomyces sp. NPDC056304]|uniref:hypothetical protein n=1 Tax=Streptomyces sp. NPDC056304 TaxID=3345778 RepID=UPI0035DC564E